MDAVGMTSRWVAAVRALEANQSEPLFHDPLADAFAGGEGRAMLADLTRAATPPGQPVAPGNPFLALRTRHFDDAVLAACTEGVRQCVILAAGMDARAFRLPWPDGVVVYEVERADVLAHKEEVLRREGAEARTRRVVVTADLRDDWQRALADAGHDRAAPSVILVEGLLPYLPDEDAVHAVLSGAAAACAPSSHVLFDTASRTFLDSPFMAGYLAKLAAYGCPWTFGTDDPEGVLQRAGWQPVEVVLPSQLPWAKARWPFAFVPRSVPGAPRTFLVRGARR